RPRQEQRDGSVENKVDTRLLQPARLEAGVVGDDTATAEEIGEYNQRACRDGAIKDHHGGALAVGKLHSAHAVQDRRQPGGLHVEGEETIAREAPLELVQRDSQEPVEGGWQPKNFSQYYFKSKMLFLIPRKNLTENFV